MAVTRLPASIGNIPRLSTLDVRYCSRLETLPYTLKYNTWLYAIHFQPSGLILPHRVFAYNRASALKQYLYDNYHPLKIFLLILAMRLRRTRRIPRELWDMIYFDFIAI